MPRMISDYKRIETYRSLRDVVEELQSLLVKYPTAIFDVDTWLDYGSPCSEVRVLFQRPETSQEEAKRKETEAKRIEWKRAQFETLKKELEGHLNNET